MRHTHPAIAFSLAVALMTLGACRPPQPVDIMTMPAVCDTIPPMVGRTARMPLVAAERSRGAIVGVVTESITGLAVPQADVRLLDPATRNAVAGPVVTDSRGGFALASLPVHGPYRLVVRSIGHDASEREVRILLGVVDTETVAMRYRVCSGY